MNWNLKTQSSPHLTVNYPEFTTESKKEVKACERMNLFYGDIISAAMKISEENRLKYFIDIKADKTEEKISVTYNLRIRDRGKTLKNITRTELWDNGVITKNKPHWQHYTKKHEKTT